VTAGVYFLRRRSRKLKRRINLLIQGTNRLIMVEKNASAQFCQKIIALKPVFNRSLYLTKVKRNTGLRQLIV
jgi:hypothetical protein